MAESSENWLKNYEKVDKVCQSISLNFNERNKYPKSSTNHTKISANIRNQLVKFGVSIGDLARTLDDLSSSGNLTRLEINRRVNMVNQLKINLKQFEQMLQDDSTRQKQSLFKSGGDDTLIDIGETNETMNSNTDQLMMHHDRMLYEQDRGLEVLSSVISNQKQIATSIGNEVDRQNVMIDSMEDKMDRIHERLVKETKNIRLIDRASGTCGLWMLIVLLLIAIIVIVAIPKK